MKVGDLTNTTGGRLKLNTELVPKLARFLKNGDEVLYIGTDSTWDYKPFFWNPGKLCPFFTIDKNENYHPDIVGNIESMPEMESDRFSAVIMIGIYEFLDHIDQAFKEIRRVLKQGGVLLVAFPGKGYYNDTRGVDLKDVLGILEGLTVSEIHLIYEGKKDPNSIIVFAWK